MTWQLYKTLTEILDALETGVIANPHSQWDRQRLHWEKRLRKELAKPANACPEFDQMKADVAAWRE